MKKQKKVIRAAGAEKPFNLSLALSLAAGGLLSSVLYFWLVSLNETAMRITTIAFMTAVSVLAIVYAVYNRGQFTRITADMLPDSMSWDQKKAYLDEAAARRKKTRWIVILLFILLVPIVLDLMKMYVLDTLFPGLVDKWLP